ncbi:glycosyltransferase family 2 protein [Caldimonas manganoxidans]|uniref:glycosyltransferase family 2 protein n=1 Tax=Caldimonas manganoxidans TaxID=196015 RepID=UPI000381650D|nr:glycosyltransferase family 2 protein [Caldimonas manganoxidans]
MPTVSVIVPCRNERAHLEAFCTSLRAQQLPEGWTMEVLVADGHSDDGSRAWLEDHAQRFGLRVIDNPQRIVSSGLNRALAVSRGEVIVRMDVHTTYATDYIAQCLAALQASGADNVGGPWRAQGEGDLSSAIAAAFQSRWLAGGARSRQLDYTGWVDTVYLGCWPRATFERFGDFDETLVRNQDDEHNLRITRGGGRIWQSAAIRCAYRPRNSLGALWRQYQQYGYWKPFVIRKHRGAASWRHWVPAALVWGLVGSLPAAWLGAAWVGALVPGLYLAAVWVAALCIAARSRWAHLPWLLLVIPTYHLSYGLGFLLGAFDAWGRGRPRASMGRLSR